MVAQAPDSDAVAQAYELALEDLGLPVMRLSTPTELEDAWNKLEHPQPVRHLKTTWFRYAAAVIILVLGTATYFFYNNTKQPVNAISQDKTDIAPGTTGAILTLADGSRVVLDSMSNGLVANQQGGSVMLQNGQLIYAGNGKGMNEAAYNIMSTPKGRQFQVILSDGSKVWLNAASSIKYPTAFTDKERLVQVTGEAYFEVVQDAARPFKVFINNETAVEVLGTTFNINAYSDEEAIKTTLVEGSVRISANKKTKILSPGQQAQVSGKNTISVVNGADLEKEMAWKHGAFNFKDATLKEVMRQLSRWYDIEVVYEKELPATHSSEFWGEISRSTSLAGVLRGLKDAGVHFKIEGGRKLIVMP